MLSSLNIQAQAEYTIEGIVLTESNEPIPYVDLLLKRNDSTFKIIAYSTSNTQGRFQINFQTDTDSIIIETSTYQYEKYHGIIKLSQRNKLLSTTIRLIPRVIELREVQVKAQPKVRFKNDTTIFTLSRFIQGNEVVVEDVLRKLPGITIEDNGRIKFKGKDVTNVLLDGSNLFDGNYSIGTKNMDISFIEGIEAIENFENNPLLQGLSENSQVALNLKLKSGLLTSHTAEATLANKERFALNSTSIFLTEKIKSFLVGSYNSIGDLLTLDSFDATTFINNVLNSRETQYSTNSVMGNARRNLPKLNNSSNSEGFGSINVLPKLSKKETLRVNVNTYVDKLGAQSTLNTTYFIPNDTVKVLEERNRTISPRFINSNVSYQRFLSEKNTITFNSKYTNFELSDNLTGVLNDSPNEERLFLRESFFGQSFSFVNRINENSALLIYSSITSSQRPERLSLIPGFAINEVHGQEISYLSQYVQSNRFVVDGNIQFLNRKEENKLSLGLQLNYTLDKLHSRLNQNDLDESVINNIRYHIYSTELFLDYLFVVKKWSYRPRASINLFTNILEESDRYIPRKTSMLTDLSLLIKFSPNLQNIFTFSSFLKQLPPEDNYLFSASILTPHRKVVNNTINLSNITTKGFDLKYRLNNLTKGASIFLGYSYLESDRGFIPISTVFENRTFITNQFLDRPISTTSYKFSANRYFPGIKSTVTLSGSFLVSNYFNTVHIRPKR